MSPMVTAKRINRQKLIGYILVAILVAGLAFLVYWLVAMDGAGDRFENIRKLRGESTSPMPGQSLDSEQMAFVSYLPQVHQAQMLRQFERSA